jgi:asparaginyl-tRNA synthetase
LIAHLQRGHPSSLLLRALFVQTITLPFFFRPQDDMRCAEDYVRYCCRFVLERCMPDLQFIVKMIDPKAIERLQHVANSNFARCSYTEGIELLQKAVEGGRKFEDMVSEPTWFHELPTKHA